MKKTLSLLIVLSLLAVSGMVFAFDGLLWPSKSTTGIPLALGAKNVVRIAATSGCTKDTDCKGERICEDGRCVEPKGKAAQTPLREPTPVSSNAGVAMQNQTWIDPQSRLMWQVMPTGGKMTWNSARSHCPTLKIGGYSDWRLPSISELRSLLRNCPDTVLGGNCSVMDDCDRATSCWTQSTCYGCTSKAGKSDGYYPDVLRGDSYGFFWASTSNAPSTNIDVYYASTTAWMIGFFQATIMPGPKELQNYARCVRNGQ